RRFREDGRGRVRVWCPAGRHEHAAQGPHILMELAPYVLDETGTSIEELVEILGAAGDTLTELGSGRSVRLDGKAIRALVPSGCSMNVLATRASTWSQTP